MDRNNIVYFPFGYTYISRINSGVKALSFLLSIILPTFLLALLVLEINVYYLSLFSLSFLSLYIAYENGYIENDTVSVIGEENPTLRLDDVCFKYLIDNFVKVIFIRTLTSLFLISVIYFFYDQKIALLTFFFYILTAYIYYFHNRVSGLSKIFTFSFLSISRFTFPFIALDPNLLNVKFILLAGSLYTIPAVIIYFYDKVLRESISDVRRLLIRNCCYFASAVFTLFSFTSYNASILIFYMFLVFNLKFLAKRFS